jgi:hypothetical protein
MLIKADHSRREETTIRFVSETPLNEKKPVFDVDFSPAREKLSDSSPYRTELRAFF